MKFLNDYIFENIKFKDFLCKSSISFGENFTPRDIKDIEVDSIQTDIPISGYLYHGSQNDDIEELEPRFTGYDGSLGWGLYLAEKEEAKNYGRHVYRVPVELKKPFRIEHNPIVANPTGKSIETMIDNNLLFSLRINNESFKDWYEKWAGYSAEYEHPYGSNVDDAIDENGNLPKAFINWLKKENRTMIADIAKKIVEIDKWYHSAISSALDQSRKMQDQDFYSKKSYEIYKERKRKLEAIGSDKLENLWDEWPENNIPIISGSILQGETVVPFWFFMGKEIIGCFDADGMENISSLVEKAGYDSIAVSGLRSMTSFLNHEVVLLRSATPDQVDGKPIAVDDENRE
jgi:hypothetical protein